MAKFITKLIPKISIKYLLFIIFIIIGCLYQIIQVTQLFLKFETKIEVKYGQNNEIIIPMVSFCKSTKILFRNSSQKIIGLSPAQIYNQTFDFNELFIELEYVSSEGSFHKIHNFKDETETEIEFEKTISSNLVCYHFKHLNSKKIKHKQQKIYLFHLYHRQNVNEIIVPYYYLFFTSNVIYPNILKDNFLFIYGKNFYFINIFKIC